MTLFRVGSGVTATVAKAAPPRPGFGYRRQARSQPTARTNRTQHTCGLGRPRSAEQGGCARKRVLAGPDTHSFPAPCPCKVRRAHLLEGGSRSARLTVGAGRQAFPPSRGAAAGVGWTLG